MEYVSAAGGVAVPAGLGALAVGVTVAIIVYVVCWCRRRD